MRTLARAALFSCALVGCAPWYRDDELRALRAADPKALATRLAECDAHATEGAREAAEHCYEAALEHSPRDARTHLGLARALRDQSKLAEARAVADHGLRAARQDGTADAPEARSLLELVLKTYAEERLYALALERAAERGPVPLAQGAESFPQAFGALQDADALAKLGKSEEALKTYASWLADYGEPDSDIVRGWSDGVLGALRGAVPDFVAAGDELAAAGNWVGALVSYGDAWRYYPRERLAEVAGKLRAAAGRVGDPSWLSPTAVDRAREAADLAERGELGQALRSYRRAVAAAPTWGEARYNLAVLLGTVGMYREAVRHMELFLSYAPPRELAGRGELLRDDWARKAEAAGGAP